MPNLLPPLCPHETPNWSEFSSDHFVMSPGFQIFRSQGTTTALLFFTRGGAGFFRAEGPNFESAHITQAGELVLWQTGSPQNYGTLPGNNWDFHWVHFHARPSWHPLLQWPPVPGVRGLSTLSLPPEDGESMETLFSSIHRDTRMGTVTRRELALNTLERVLLLAHEQARSRAGRPMDARVRAALERIAAEPAHPHSVAELAQAAGLSPSRFAHLFSEQTGESVIETVLRTRLQQAERLLTLSSSSVSEIAFAVGFSSLSLFTRHFTARYGRSPRAYRAGLP